MADATILIATHRRNHVLKWNLESLARQNNDVEVIVLDDCYIQDEECKLLVAGFKDKLNVRYVHSGKTKNGKNTWRVPGFAYNIGARLATSNILIVSCGEMFHVGNTTGFIIEQIRKNDNLQCTVNGIDDKRGIFLSTLEQGKNITSEQCKLTKHDKLRVALPFFLGVAKEKYFAIGGYDESFIGIAYEDNDFIERLERFGVEPSHKLERSPIGYSCRIDVPTDLWIIHLHTPHVAANQDNKERMEFNRLLRNKNRDASVVVVNKDREWGKL